MAGLDRRRVRRAAVWTAVAMLAVAGGPVAAQTVIDDFSDAGLNTADPPGVTRTTLGTTTVVDSGLSGVLGGARQLTVQATAVGGGSPEVRGGVITMAERLVYSSTVLANGRVALLYDGNGAGLNANLAPGDGITFDLVGDASFVPCAVTVRISDGVITESSTQNVVVSGATSVQFLYSSFPTVDLSAVFSVEVDVDPNQAGDLELGPRIETFGEPFCGNGEVDMGEVCDDANAFAGDGCEPDCTLSAACTFAPAGPPTERFVGGCGAPSFGSVQAAISASSSGDIVSVCPGTYNESVLIDQEVTLRSTGGAAVTTIASPGVALDVRRSGVRIEDLTVEGTTAAIRADQICGLGLASCAAPGRGSNLTITGNVVQNSALGVGWQRKIDCASITANTMTANAAHIDLDQQEGAAAIFVTIESNTITGGGGSGASVNLQGLGANASLALNTIENSAAAGVVLANLQPGTQCLENNIRDSVTDGLVIKPGAAGVRVLQNNIEGNAIGLANEAPEGTVDATLNWWGSQSGPLHTIDFPTGTGDQIVERFGGLDTLFIEFLCAPAPAGFPSVLAMCDDGGGGQEVEFLTFGRAPDISPNGRYISFASDKDLNGDIRLSVANADGSDEAFLLNRKPNGKDNSFCLGGVSPGAACNKQSDCPADLNQDPIITDGACVLITQLTHDPSGNNEVLTPRATQGGTIFLTSDADLVGQNADLSKEVVRWSARDFRRQSPNDPNVVVDAISNGAAGIDSQEPAPSRNGRYVLMESIGNPTGQNADGNSEIFYFDINRNTWMQVTNTVAPVQNHRPSTQSGRQVHFDSDGDLTGGNADGNREVFYGELRGQTWVITQLTTSGPGIDNRAGQLAKRGRIFTFSSNANYLGQNADGNSEIFVIDRGVLSQITQSTAGENVHPHMNPRGRFVTFESTSNLESGANAVINRRVFLYDRKLSNLIVVSRSFFGNNFVPRLSNGRFVVWESTANLTGQNPLNERVIYAFDRRKDD
ncbi:MAG: NosD domain-containing protein [Candidatus Binatia bacterium]